MVRLAVWQTVSNGLATACEVRFTGDGKPLLTAELEAKKGRQAFDLSTPATFRELTMAVLSVTPGELGYGSLSEIEGFDADGKNVLLSPPRQVVRATPASVQMQYSNIKQADPTRPVFMTLTSNFMPTFQKKQE